MKKDTPEYKEVKRLHRLGYTTMYVARKTGLTPPQVKSHIEDMYLVKDRKVHFGSKQEPYHESELETMEYLEQRNSKPQTFPVKQLRYFDSDTRVGGVAGFLRI